MKTIGIPSDMETSGLRQERNDWRGEPGDSSRDPVG
jgi:hypothetical protein